MERASIFADLGETQFDQTRYHEMCQVEVALHVCPITLRHASVNDIQTLEVWKLDAVQRRKDLVRVDVELHVTDGSCTAALATSLCFQKFVEHWKSCRFPGQFERMFEHGLARGHNA